MAVEEEGKKKRDVLVPVPGRRVLLNEEELTYLLKKSQNSATANLQEAFILLYDGQDYTPRTRSRSLEVRQPFFSIVSTTTPEALRSRLTDVEVDSGFFPRFSLWVGNWRDPIAMPLPPDPAGMTSLADGLRVLRSHAEEVGQAQNGLVQLDDIALLRWDVYYYDHRNEVRNSPAAVAGMLQRIPEFVLKYALLYSLFRGASQVSDDDLARACSVGNYLTETARIVPETIHQTPVARVEHRILEALERLDGKWVPVSRIHKMVGGRISSYELTCSLEAFVKLDRVERMIKEVRGRTVPCYRLKK